ncbi:MAG: bifunctional phosphoglucose/phosphomannose isomerase [Chloroflexota bacterium]
MRNLDNPRTYEQSDPSLMRSHLRGLPQQCRQAWEQVMSFPLPRDYSEVDKVVILGMGGSAIGGDLLRSLVSGRTRLLVWSHRDYGLPAFVDERTLVVASSYSGMTEETLDGLSKALATRCKKVVITTGSKLEAMAERHGLPVFRLSYRSPPRAALGYSLIPLVGVLQKLGLIPDLSGEFNEAVRVLEGMCSRLAEDVPLATNNAKGLARRLYRRLPVVYGAGITAPVAYRWKTQLNENAKYWSFSEVLPELDHNSVAGYSLPAELKDVAFVVILEAPALHQRHLDRYVVTRELLDRAGISHTTVNSEGNGVLGQMLSLVFLGDWTSYYLAMLHGNDPNAIPAIDYLKERLSHTPEA